MEFENFVQPIRDVICLAASDPPPRSEADPPLPVLRGNWVFKSVGVGVVMSEAVFFSVSTDDEIPQTKEAANDIPLEIECSHSGY